MHKIDAMLSFYMHIPHPEKLSDVEYSEKWRQLLWVLEFDSKRKNSNEKVLEI